MKLKLAFAVCFLLVAFANAQSGIDNLWLMGENGNPPNGPTNIDFISGTPNAYAATRSMNFYPTNGLISDTAGNLLFYTNGCYIANALNNLMFNGDSLNPSSFTNNYCPTGLPLFDGNIVIPAPGSKSRYYLFHETGDDSVSYCALDHPSKLYYSVIDMEQQGGLGAVIEKNVVIINTSITVGLNDGFLTATKHANGRDWWVVTHGLNNNIFYTLLVTPDGVQGPFMQAIGPIGSCDGTGRAVFSPDGSMLATSDWWTNEGNNGWAIPKCELFDFDRCTGQFSNYRFIYSNSVTGGIGGLEFSPNSRFLYVMSVDSVLQFDVTASNIPSSMVLVGLTVDSIYGPGLGIMQSAYNNKIYILGPTVLAFSSINYPDSAGLACNFQLNSLQLPHPNGGETLPNYPNYRLGALIGSACDTITTSLIPGPSPKEKGELHVFPNPASSHLTIALSIYKKVEVTIADITGKVIYSTTASGTPQLEVNTKNFSEGVYIVQLKSDEFVETRKVVVTK